MTILAVGAVGKFAAWSFPPWLDADREYAAWSASRIRSIRCENGRSPPTERASLTHPE